MLRDAGFLKTCAPILDFKDFAVTSSASRVDKIKSDLAKIGLQFYVQYNTPLRGYSKTEIANYAKKNKLPDSWRKDALAAYKDLGGIKVKAATYVIDRLVDFKKEQAKKNAITKLIDLQESGDLTDEQWQDICTQALLPDLRNKYAPIDYLKRLEKRIERRRFVKENRYPVSFIEPLDRRVRLIARGHLGLILAPYKRGKSLMLIHMAVALLLQHYNVLHISLEDQRDDVEDRFDAAISFIPIKELGIKPKILRERFERFKRFLYRRNKLKLVDGTGGNMTVAKMQTVFDQCKNDGFFPDGVILDYGDKLKPSKNHRDKRFESDEIYQDLVNFAANNQVFFWTATQSKRGTSDKQVVVGDDAAEDITKMQKADCAISLGLGEWGPESIYAHIAAHRHDRQHIGCNIMADLDRMRIYDADKTRKALEAHPVMKRRE